MLGRGSVRRARGPGPPAHPRAPRPRRGERRATSPPPSGPSSGSRSPPSRSTSACCGTAVSRPCVPRARAASTRSGPIRCVTSTSGSTASAATGHPRSTRWPPSSPAASAGDASTRRAPTRGARDDRRHPASARHEPHGRLADDRGGRGPCGHDQPDLRRRPRGRVGRVHEPRADPALVPPRHRRPPAGRPLPARGQRRRHDPGMRPAPRRSGRRGTAGTWRTGSRCA